MNPLRFVVASILLLLFAANASADTLSIRLTFADLPQNITLCRDGMNSADEFWEAFVDVDGDSSTGYSPTGSEAVLFLQTAQQPPGCTAHVVPLDANALSAQLITFDALGNYSGQGLSAVSVSTAVNTLTLTVETSGTIAGLSSLSRVQATSSARYSAPSGDVYATDTTGLATLGTSIPDPAGDVALCTAPCSPAAEYYPLVDIIGIDFKLKVATAADYANFEFDLDALPSSLLLCRDPNAFANSIATYDSQWAELVDVDGNPATGYSGYDAYVVVRTTAQSTDCSPHYVPIADALSAGITKINDDGNPGISTNAALSIEVAGGKLIVRVPYDNPVIQGFAANATAAVGAVAYYGDAASTQIAQDAIDPSIVGAPSVDPLHDLLNCSGACSTGAEWYPQTDLVGAAITRADTVFKENFE